jgi:hypothetical protein
VLSTWASWTRRSRQRRHTGEVAAARADHYVQLRAWLSWVRATHASQQSKWRESFALQQQLIAHERGRGVVRLRLARVLVALRTAVAMRAYAEDRMRAPRSAHARLCFLLWREHTQRRRTEKLLLRRALFSLALAPVRVAFATWRRHCALSTKSDALGVGRSMQELALEMDRRVQRMALAGESIASEAKRESLLLRILSRWRAASRASADRKKQLHSAEARALQLGRSRSGA